MQSAAEVVGRQLYSLLLLPAINLPIQTPKDEAVGRLLRHGGGRCCCASLELHKIEVDQRLLIPPLMMTILVFLAECRIQAKVGL